jgi:polyisoprenoid-binding protein YceI
MTVEIDAASIEADVPMLTNHLKSKDFFAVAEFPKITFRSTKIVSVAGKKDECMITGDLKIRDKTVSITFPAKVKNEKTFFMESEFDLSRKEIGQTYGADKINDKVHVTVTVGKQMTK